MSSKEQGRKVLRSNNFRALLIHFAVTIAGIFAYGPILTLYGLFAAFEDGINFFPPIPVLLTLIAVLCAYLYCGYRFLHPTVFAARRSVLWLTIVVFVAGIFMWTELAGIVASNSLTLAIFTIGLYINLLSFVAVMIPFNIGLEVDPGTFAPVIILAISTFLPPALLCLGLHLKMRQGSKVASEGDR